jgi:hypothetical protein
LSVSFAVGPAATSECVTRAKRKVAVRSERIEGISWRRRDGERPYGKRTRQSELKRPGETASRSKPDWVGGAKH